MKTYKDIDGWFDYESLYIEQVNKAQDGAVFVEIGAYHGKSTVFMGQLIKESGKNIKFYSLDALYGVVEHIWPNVHIPNLEQKKIIESNLVECDVSDYVTMIYEDSVKAVGGFEDLSIDFLFIDGCHGYLDVSRDILKWIHKVKWGGDITGHDYIDFHPEVRQAVHDCLPKQLLMVDLPRVWRVKKNPLDIGAPSRLPSSEYIICMPYMGGPYTPFAIESLKPYWDNLLVIDQTGKFPNGPWSTLRPHFKMSFAQLQNNLIWWCAKQGYKYMIYSHEDIEVHNHNTLPRMLQIAKEVEAPLILTEHDTFSLWDVRGCMSMGAYDEQLPFYYTDIDYLRRMKMHGGNYVGLQNHEVLHYGSVTLKTKPQHVKDKMWQEIKASYDKYVSKWGGAPGGETYAKPYNFK